MLVEGAIGVFDSGYGGLTILGELQKYLPQYNYIYLGDNSRAPYGSRSFDVIYEYTLQAVKELFARGCNLVILACNTASAKALRTIQQKDLPLLNPNKRILGIIRPTVEIVNQFSQTKHIGILGTEGTVQSKSYTLEINKLHPTYHVVDNACPMWVPLVENMEAENDGADFFVRKYINQLLDKDHLIDTIILACTHYPLLLPKILQYAPKHIHVISQGEYIAQSLIDYLHRHSEIENYCLKEGMTTYLTTESASKFCSMASVFLNKSINAERIILQ